jgi:NADH-quinone oxidoreductase subunit I
MLGGGLIQGLVVTARNFIQSYTDPDRLVTQQYPEEKPAVPENSRAFPFLIYDGTPDNIRCVACKICESECPPQCIYIEVARDPKTGKMIRRPAVFDIDYSVCMQCQICVEMCPFDSIKMDQVYELANPDRYDGLLFKLDALAKSNDYYHGIHPREAAEVDAHLSKTKKKPITTAAKSAAPAPTATAVPSAAATSAAAPAVPAAAPAEAAAPEMPWHDQALEMGDRMKLAEGKPLPLRLMAAMAQLDCNACGYDCQGYAAAIASGAEKDLTLCAPGEKPTQDKIKEILKAEGRL